MRTVWSRLKRAKSTPPHKRRSGSINDMIPQGTPVEAVEIQRSLQMELASFGVREDLYPTYACKHYEEETGEAVVVQTPMASTAVPGSFASPSAIAYLAVQKYVMYSPLYRLEQEFERQG